MLRRIVSLLAKGGFLVALKGRWVSLKLLAKFAGAIQTLAVVVAVLFRPYLLFLGGAVGVVWGLHYLGVLPVVDFSPLTALAESLLRSARVMA